MRNTANFITILITTLCANQVIAATPFVWKNEYPIDKPVPKAEWLALVKDDPALSITPNILTPSKKKKKNRHFINDFNQTHHQYV